MKIFGTALSLFLLAVCLLTTAPAQTTFGTITGTVTDATGAVLAGAPVTVTNEETGVVRRAATAANGVYTVVDLQPGTYKLSVTAKAGDGSAVNSTVTTTGVVSEVDMTSGTPVLMVGPMAVNLADVAGVLDISSTTGTHN